MKQHKFEEYKEAFGWLLFKCHRCGALSIDLELAPYHESWRVVSEDCDKAGKQIEILDLTLKKKKYRDEYDITNWE